MADVKKGKTPQEFAVDFLMGGVSAAVAKTSAAPIERIKLLIQNQDEMIKQGRLATPYKGIGDAFTRTYRDEGLVSLWRGNTANVIRYFPTQALNFAFRLLQVPFRLQEERGLLEVVRRNVASGGAAGASSLLFVYSLDYARTRLANDAKSAKGGGARQFNGLVDVYRKTLASDGIAGLYRGFVPSVVGIIVYRGLYFGVYDSLKPVVLVGALEGSFFASFLLGWGVTIGAGLASYPLDTIRRRMMMTSGSGVNYKSMFDAGSQIIAKEGVKSLFKGAGANILRGVAGAGVLSIYDKLQAVLFGKVYSVTHNVAIHFCINGELRYELHFCVCVWTGNLHERQAADPFLTQVRSQQRLSFHRARYTHTTPPIVLRPYQEDCIKECLDWLGQGVTRIGVSLPTGSGKTTVFISLLSRIAALEQKPMKALVVVNSVELARQSAAQAARMFPSWSVEIEQGAKHKASGFADFTAATYQTLLNSKRLAKFNPHQVTAVIIDEAHHAAAPSYRKLLSHFHPDIRHPDKDYVPPVDPQPLPIIGFSATFSRHDGLALGSVFERIVYHRDVLQMIDEDWLCGVRLTSVKVSLDLNKVVLNANGDFATSSLARVMNTPAMNDLVVRTWLDRAAADRKSTLIFCVDIAHVEALTSAFRTIGVDARFVTGKTNVKARKELVAAFRAGEFPVLLNCAVLTEGADIPSIDCVIVARPTRSKNIFAQMIGRGMRLSPETGKEDCHIIDYVDTVNRVAGVMSVPTLLGLDPLKLNLEGKSLDELREETEALQLRHSVGLQEEARSEDVAQPREVTYEEHENLDSLYDALKEKEVKIRMISRFAWVTCKNNLHVLQSFNGVKVKISKTSDTENPFIAKQYRWVYMKGVGKVERSFPVLTAATLEDAVHGADTWIATKVPDAHGTLSHSAQWRRHPASAAQIKQVMQIYHTQQPADVHAFLAAIGLILKEDRIPSADEIEERLKRMRKGQLVDAVTRLKHHAHVGDFSPLFLSAPNIRRPRNTTPKKGERFKRRHCEK
ncbi:hypothetical protein NMY22_g50 [Coprinellus aureogranulatus]|nr:hypothetical protein NMY22_g50 [Coprinellus aureogranulatus]